MNSNFAKVIGASSLVLAASLARAQVTWDGVCIDPKNMMPYSIPFGTDNVSNDLFSATVGVVGTVTYGGAMGPCFVPANTINVSGRIGFAIGAVGSVQSSFDDLLNLTFGMPISPGGSWNDAEIIIDGAQTMYGSVAPTTHFHGASDNYVYQEGLYGKIRVQLRIDVIGDAARVDWTLVNTDTASHTLGLWFGQAVSMLAQSADPVTGAQFSGALTAGGGAADKPAYMFVPGKRPPTTEQRYIKAQDPAGFPLFVDFCFGQDKGYGLHVDLGPTLATSDDTGSNSDATSADEMALGDESFLFRGNSGGDGALRDHMFGPNNGPGDVTITGEPGYIQKFGSQTVPAGASRKIVQYFHSTWSVSNYSRPYSVVVDAPVVIASRVDGLNGLDQDPAAPRQVRVYVDNTRGFSTVDKSIEIDNVQVTLKLQKGLGLSFAPTEQVQNVVEQVNGQPVNFYEVQKSIPVIKPATLDHVDFGIVADGIGFGALPYTVTVVSTPGPGKTLNGAINVSTTPRLTLNTGVNLVSSPYIFSDTSLEAILGLRLGIDFQAFTWDPVNKGYIPATSLERGHSLFIVTNSNLGSVTLKGNPTVPITDLINGAPLITLKSGWNLIANPYNYAFPLGQIVGARGNPNGQQSYTWDELVNQGAVSGSLAYFDPNIGGYAYLSGDQAMMLPNVGYWLYVYDLQDFTLEFPPIFQEFLPGSTRAKDGWIPGPNDWRLNLSVRDKDSIDGKVYIGAMSNAQLAKSLQTVKPPLAPNQTLTMALETEIKGVKTRMAQSLATSAGKTAYKVVVDSQKGGTTTVTWPNMTVVPRNLRFRLVDLSTNTTRDMRQTSGYTFSAQPNSHREFRLEVEPASGTSASIGNVIVVPGRGPRDPFTISYTLSDGAQTTVRILSGSGKEIKVATRGRADNVGQNTVVWDLKDQANRSVAPGIYRVEITAELNGERVRRIVSLNVRG